MKLKARNIKIRYLLTLLLLLISHPLNFETLRLLTIANVTGCLLTGSQRLQTNGLARKININKLPKLSLDAKKVMVLLSNGLLSLLFSVKSTLFDTGEATTSSISAILKSSCCVANWAVNPPMGVFRAAAFPPLPLLLPYRAERWIDM